MSKIRCEPSAWTYQSWTPGEEPEGQTVTLTELNEVTLSVGFGDGEGGYSMSVESAEALRFALNAWAQNRDREHPEENPDE